MRMGAPQRAQRPVGSGVAECIGWCSKQEAGAAQEQDGGGRGAGLRADAEEIVFQNGDVGRVRAWAVQLRRQGARVGGAVHEDVQAERETRQPWPATSYARS